jgi:hypothetical protein
VSLQHKGEYPDYSNVYPTNDQAARLEQLRSAAVTTLGAKRYATWLVSAKLPDGRTVTEAAKESEEGLAAAKAHLQADAPDKRKKGFFY